MKSLEGMMDNMAEMIVGTMVEVTGVMGEIIGAMKEVIVGMEEIVIKGMVETIEIMTETLIVDHLKTNHEITDQEKVVPHLLNLLHPPLLLKKEVILLHLLEAPLHRLHLEEELLYPMVRFLIMMEIT